MKTNTESKFADFHYMRPDFEEMQLKFSSMNEQFRCGLDAKGQMHIIHEINALRKDFETMENLAFIRHTLDTSNAFYREEHSFFNTTRPLYDKAVTSFYSSLLNISFRDELERELGSQFSLLAESQIRTLSPEVIELLAEENKLGNEYQILIASAKIDFDGQERNIAQMKKYLSHSDRELRQRASHTMYDLFQENSAELDEIYDKLVKVRSQIALKLGFDNFIDLAYIRMSRTDWNQESAKAFREAVLKYVVPLANELVEKQRQRIGVDKIKFYDEKFYFPSGNPAPKGDANWIIEQGSKLYSELSNETGAFFDEMTRRGLFDLVDKNGKANVGYCTMLWGQQAPFVFANFNGTANDIRVLSHEVGHAFQAYLSLKGDKVPEYHFPTMEAAEIHSMTMELFVSRWADLLFKEDADKQVYSQVVEALLKLPMICAVDEFQHEICANQDLSPVERRNLWTRLEQKYMPYTDNDNCTFLNAGGYWQTHMHVYTHPLYFIDYALAQICAFQFWQRSQDDWQGTWNSYLHLCRLGGSKSFLQLIEESGLKSPFEESVIKETVAFLEHWLGSIDDSKF